MRFAQEIPTVAHTRKPESHVFEIPACFLKGVQSGAREGNTRLHVLESLHGIEGMAMCFGNAKRAKFM